MNHRCAKCGAELVDVLDVPQYVEDDPLPKGYTVREGCAKCDGLELVDVVRQLYVPKNRIVARQVSPS